MIEPLEGAGITVLLNDATGMQRHGEKIWIVGVDDPHYFKCHDLGRRPLPTCRTGHSASLWPTPTKSIGKLPPTILSCTFAGTLMEARFKSPLLGAIFTHSSAPRSFLYGPWQYDGMLGYTSCGVGVSGVPVRFSTQGEVLLITLKNDQDPGCIVCWRSTMGHYRIAASDCH